MKNHILTRIRKFYLTWAVVMGLVGVMLGALGTHGLATKLSDAALKSFEVGLLYQWFHALALLAISLSSWVSEKTIKTVGLLLILGVGLFSGSIYLLSLDEWMGYDCSFLGPVTPIGGLLLMLAWAMLLFSILKKN